MCCQWDLCGPGHLGKAVCDVLHLCQNEEAAFHVVLSCASFQLWLCSCALFVRHFPRLPPSVIQVLLLPCGRWDGAVRIHDDFCTTDDHDDQEKAKENKACQR